MPLTIVNFHYIRNSYIKGSKGIRGETTEELRRMMAALRCRFSSGNPDELTIESRVASDRDYLLITFDDALAEQYQYALPIILEYEMPVLFFANSDAVFNRNLQHVHLLQHLRNMPTFNSIAPQILQWATDRGVNKTLTIALAEQKYKYDDPSSRIIKYLWNFIMNYEERVCFIKEKLNLSDDALLTIADKLYMTPGMLRSLAELGMVGLHGHRHEPYGSLNRQQIVDDLAENTRLFRSNGITRCDTISYPYGDQQSCPTTLRELVGSFGVKYGITMQRGINCKNNRDLIFLKRYSSADLKQDILKC